MQLCYIDESGTPDIPGNTSHFVLAGLSVPIYHWRDADREVSQVLRRYGLDGQEVHTAWILRRYPEQLKIPAFDAMSRDQRRSEVLRSRTARLLQLQRSPADRRRYRQEKKNFAHTDAYVHLTEAERRSLVRDVADVVAGWGFARLFAECIDKRHFVGAAGGTPETQAFEQIVSRFEQHLKSSDADGHDPAHGILIHDNNDTVARKHTQLMRDFHRRGTLWTKVERIIETPLFVDSKLTSMVQIADLCCYALRRYFENREADLMRKVMQRAHRVQGVAVGVRHFSDLGCACEVCLAHRPRVVQHAAPQP